MKTYTISPNSKYPMKRFKNVVLTALIYMFLNNLTENCRDRSSLQN